MVRNLVVTGTVALDWIVADEEYGRAGHFLDELEALEQRYVLEVPVTTAVWTADPASCVPAYSGRGRTPTEPGREAVRTVAALAAELPASAWQALQVREGSSARWSSSSRRCGSGRCGTASRSRRSWLLIRRSLEEEPETQVLHLERRGRDARCRRWRWWPAVAVGWRSSSRTARVTWAWRSTRRGRGSAGIATHDASVVTGHWPFGPAPCDSHL